MPTAADRRCLLAEIYDWSMGAAAAQFEGEHMVSETWRRVRYLVDEARAWTDETGGTLAEYLAWVADKVEAVERSEIAPDETDEDAVRILTIHAAKGLEFPIVVVAGLGTKDSAAGDRFRVAFVDDGVELSLGAADHARLPRARPDAAEAEEARLLYVGMTRARDHLVVSCHTSKRIHGRTRSSNLAGHLDLDRRRVLDSRHRSPRQSWCRTSTSCAPCSHATGRPKPSCTAPDRADRRTSGPPRRSPPATTTCAEGAPAEQRRSRRRGAGDDAGRPAALPRDAIEFLPADPGLQRDPASGLEVLRSRGRYGTDAGKAVHEVMQRVDLADPHTGLDALVDAACDNVDLVDPEPATAGRILAASIVRSALFQRMRARGGVRAGDLRRRHRRGRRRAGDDLGICRCGLPDRRPAATPSSTSRPTAAPTRDDELRERYSDASSTRTRT